MPSQSDILHKHPVSGTIVEEWIIPARGYAAFHECRQNIACPPSTYLKRFFYDTVNFDPRAIELAISFAGPDQILAGSDHPHQIGSVEKMFESIRTLRIPEEGKSAILGTNATRLLQGQLRDLL